jgi:HSP20 family molecular chaperone IbpA
MAVLVRRRDMAAPPIQRYQPFPEIREMQEQLGQLMEQVMSAEDGGVWVPNVDIEETEDAWVVEAEVPGVKREDADVEVRDSEVVISGEIKERERKGVLRRKTRPRRPLRVSRDIARPDRSGASRGEPGGRRIDRPHPEAGGGTPAARRGALESGRERTGHDRVRAGGTRGVDPATGGAGPLPASPRSWPWT